MLANADIRTTAKEKGVFLWEIADKLCISEAYFIRKLRYEFSDTRKREIFKIIDEISAGNKETSTIMFKKANADIRVFAKEKGVRQWEIAEYLKISEPTLIRKMRKELSEKEKAVYFDIIEKLAAEKQALI